MLTGFTGRRLEEAEDRLSTDLVLLDMLDFALQRADRHFPAKVRVVRKVSFTRKVFSLSCGFLLSHGKAVLECGKIHYYSCLF